MLDVKPNPSVVSEKERCDRRCRVRSRPGTRSGKGRQRDVDPGKDHEKNCDRCQEVTSAHDCFPDEIAERLFTNRHPVAMGSEPAVVFAGVIRSSSAR
jgi:hypothetical protein